MAISGEMDMDINILAGCFVIKKEKNLTMLWNAVKHKDKRKKERKKRGVGVGRGWGGEGKYPSN